MNNLADIRALLQERIGLREDVLNPSTVKAAVDRRRTQCQVSDEKAYLTRLQQDPTELAQLVEEVVVPETWFLRDRGPFQALAEYVSRSMPAGPAKPLRILSVPCATGEEPYSISIVLTECGLSTHQFQIDAIDVSERSLQVARQGVYRQYSFRGQELAFRDRYFEKLPRGEFRLIDKIRVPIQFAKGNVVTAEFLQGQARYDVIFCRNLLIYLDDRSRVRVLENLDRLLVAEGRLFVGHAEAGPPVLERFQVIGEPSAFAFVKRATSANRQRPGVAGPRPIERSPETPPIGRRLIRDAEPKRPPSAVRTEIVEATGPPDLKMAEQLANSGQLEEAHRLCTAYLKINAVCAKGFYLLAVISMARGDRSEAEKLLSKVVYLEPRHVEAMLYLAHLADARGDLAGARQWRQRLERVQKPAVSV